MKRYLLFKGSAYYPGGGWDDFAGAFDTIPEAKAMLKPRDYSEWGWWHIVDTETMDTIDFSSLSTTEPSK